MGLDNAVKERIAPRKTAGFDFPRGTSEGPAEIILRGKVLPREARTAVAQDRGDVGRGCSAEEQFLGDPFIGDAPVGLWEAVENPQSMQPTGIDVGRISDVGGGMSRPVCANRITGRRLKEMWRRRLTGMRVQMVLGRLQQRVTVRSQAGMGIQDLYPRRVTAPVAAVWFLIGEAGQAAQMAPIGAGRIAIIEVGQLFTDLAGKCRFDGGGADLHPSLEIARAGLEYHTGFVTGGPHGGNDGWVSVIQIDEDVSRVALLGVEMDVNVAAFPIADAQEADRGWLYQLGGCPQPFTGKRPSGLRMNQADEIEVVRHCRKLAADGLHGDMESKVQHGPNFGIKRPRRTMNFQRAANSGLTRCLSPWVHRTSPGLWLRKARQKKHWC